MASARQIVLKVGATTDGLDNKPAASWMSQDSPGDCTPRPQTRRYEVVLLEDERGIERLTLARLSETVEEIAQLDEEKLISIARDIYEARQRRSRYIASSLLGEPAWDMLLALYSAASGKPLSITSLAYAARVPQTSGLRKCQLLEDRGLILRSADRQDKRRVHVRLTTAGRVMVSRYLASVYYKIRR